MFGPDASLMGVHAPPAEPVREPRPAEKRIGIAHKFIHQQTTLGYIVSKTNILAVRKQAVSPSTSTERDSDPVKIDFLYLARQPD
jgi:hypothetical protein